MRMVEKNLRCLSNEQKRLLISPDSNVTIARQCELINLNRSNYYYEPKAISNSNLQILNLIDEIYTSNPCFGTRRMVKELKDHGIYMLVGIKLEVVILGLEAIYPKPNLSKHNPKHKIYPYLLRNTLITRVNQVWSASITYVRLAKGFVYLVAIIDWFSRFILSWRLSNSLHHEFCLGALHEALSIYSKPEIFNTDQGAQFTSLDWINKLTPRAVAISMDGRGRALDNIFIERFWRSIKQEKIYLVDFKL